MKILFVVLLSLVFGLSISAQKKGGKKKMDSSIKQLTINPNFIEVDKKKKQVIYSPDSGRKSASYTYYVFEQKHYKNKVGKQELPQGTVFEYKEIRRENKNHTPSNPYEQAPQGGFDLTYIYCEIVNVVLPK
jgi:hypothetical protein